MKKKTTKLISVLLTLVMLLSLLPMTALAAEEEKETIPSISATVTLPTAGTHPVETGTPGDSSYTVLDVHFYDDEDHQLEASDIFEAGETYRIYVTFRPVAGKAIESSASATINGETAAYWGPIADGWGSKTFYIDYTVPANAAPTTITSIHITGITAPTDGSSPYLGLEEITTDTPGLEITSVFWYRNSSLQNYPFEAGYTYNLTIHFDIDEGYEFSDSVTVDHDLPDGTLSGKSLTIDTPWISIDYTIPAAESTPIPSVKVSDVTVPVIGATPDFDITLTGTGFELDEYPGEPAVIWYKVDIDGEFVEWVPMDGDTPFGAGLYSLEVYLKAKDGYAFTDATEFCYGEEKLPEYQDDIDGKSNYELWDGGAGIYLYFTVEEPAAPTEITSLSATVTEPVAGASPSFEAVTGGESYTAELEWEIVAEETIIYPEDDHKFEAGEEYGLWVAFIPEDGYEFADDVTITINGKTPEDTYEYGDEIVGLVTYTIPAAEPTKYTVTVTNGTGSGEYEENARVTITANTPEEGKQFKEWTGVDGLTFTTGNKNSATAIFTMPAQAVNVTATYEDVPAPQTATIVVEKWTANQQPLAGATFTLTKPGSVEPAYTAFSGADGLVTFTDVADGSYTLAESAAPEGYVTTEDTWDFIVRNGEAYVIPAEAPAAVLYENENPLTVTNEPASVPTPETVDVYGTKTWAGDEEGGRPESIIVNLLANGEAVGTVEVTEESQWTFSFTDKAKYDASGAEIVYTVQEEPVEGYTASYNGYNITNTKDEEPVTVEIPVTKAVAKGGNKNFSGSETFEFKIEVLNANVNMEALTITGNAVTVTDMNGGSTTIVITVPGELYADVCDEGIRITEKAGSAEGWTYSTERYLVALSPNGIVGYYLESDTAAVDADDIVFTNTYTKNVTTGGGGGGGGGSAPSGGGGGSASSKPVLNKEDHMAFLQGYADGTFRPEKNMTRAQVTVMFARLLVEKMEVGKTYTNSFSDVPADYWAANEIGYMEKFGIINGFTDGTFRPNDPVTRAQFAAIACRFEELTEGTKTFSDVPADHWAAKYISYAAERGWVGGFTDGTFRPNDYITRAQVAAVTCRLLERNADEKYIEKHFDDLTYTFSDMTEQHFAYWYALEASNGHDYTKKADKETWSSLLK